MQPVQHSTQSAGGDQEDQAYELRYCSLFHQGRGLSFPCDCCGNVDMDKLSERARDNYLYARAVIGVEYATPVVQRTH